MRTSIPARSREFPPVWSPVLTQFNVDLKPSGPRFFQHRSSLLRQDVGLAIFGTNSEANSLTRADRARIAESRRAGLWPALAGCRGNQNNLLVNQSGDRFFMPSVFVKLRA